MHRVESNRYDYDMSTKQVVENLREDWQTRVTVTPITHGIYIYYIYIYIYYILIHIFF